MSGARFRRRVGQVAASVLAILLMVAMYLPSSVDQVTEVSGTVKGGGAAMKPVVTTAPL